MRRPPHPRRRLAAVILFASMTASAQPTTVPSADRTFAEKAAMGGVAEVQSGKLAEQKGVNAQVKQFGARMAQDHAKAGDELKQIASGKGLKLPDEPDPQSKQEMAKLEKLSGAAFDRAYMSHMVADHKKDIAAFEKEAASGKDPEIKAYAAKTLPTLREHLQIAAAAEAALRK